MGKKKALRLNLHHNPSVYAQHTLHILLLALCSIEFAGCDAIKSGLAFLSPNQEGGADLGQASLEVIVDPPDTLTILLDGNRIGSMSPHKEKNLMAGHHQLEVRAMGYHPFTADIELFSHRHVLVPVKLRRRLDAVPISPPTIRPAPSRQKKRAPPPPKPPETIAPNLPPGTGPYKLRIHTMPPLTIKVDGIVRKSPVNLRRTSGRLDVGAFGIRYRAGGAGLLFLSMPIEGNCTKDGRPRRPSATFRLDRGATRLECDLGGVHQVILLGRI